VPAQKGVLLYQRDSATVKVGLEATAGNIIRLADQMAWGEGNYIAYDSKTIQARMQFLGKQGSATADADTTVALIKTGLASAFTGTATKKSTWVSKVGATTALATKTAAACTNPTEATCISKHPTKCKSTTGGLSTIATVGAAIAALAMSF